MIRAGQLVLLSFPQTDQAAGRLRPTLVLRRLPGPYDDWLVCMISSQLRHEVSGVDEVVREADPDFADTGLKTTSVIRVTRIAVVSADILHGTIGKLNEERLTRSAPALPIGFSALPGLEMRRRPRQNKRIHATRNSGRRAISCA